jgi:hypothetical protein
MGSLCHFWKLDSRVSHLISHRAQPDNALRQRVIGTQEQQPQAKVEDSYDYETEDHHTDRSLSGNRVPRSRHPANVLESGMPVLPP